MEQGTLFDSDVEELGYRGPVACRAASITYRQLDYWARTGLVEPSRAATGSGSQRLYSFTDVLLLRVVRSLLDAGVSLPNIRAAISFLRETGQAITTTTLVSDGATIFACTDDDQVIDVLRGGQAMFGIALQSVGVEVDATLSQLPSESLGSGNEGSVVQPLDELSVRRQARLAS